VTDLVLVDWLGRGGIAQTTESWRQVASEAGLDVSVVSRTSEAIAADVAVEKRLPGLVGALETHVRLLRRAQAVVRARPPTTVYLQNYWIPPLEKRLAISARNAGSRVVIAVHNHRPHALRAGTSRGLHSLLAAADAVVTHSDLVRDELRENLGIGSRVVSHPIQTGMLRTTPVPVARVTETAAGRRIAVAFGVLARGYKGGPSLSGLAPSIDRDWLVVAAGVGASTVTGAELVVDRFLREGELRWLVEQADVALLPYRSATQSGAVVLAQMLGTPPIATAVGAIPEQISDGIDGLLVDPAASVDHWVEALRRLDLDPSVLSTLCRGAQDRTQRRAKTSAEEFLQIVGGK
jgi:glycosyltransferase involved in cell wall biosynthesis